MAKFNTLQSSFSSGMVSPKFNGRSDLDIYNRAVEELINMYPTPEGGARTRNSFSSTGVVLSDETYLINSPRKFTTIPFVDSLGENYTIEIRQSTTSLLIDFYKIKKDYLSSSLVEYKEEVTYSVGYDVQLFLVNKNYDIKWAYVGDAVILTTGKCEPIIIYRYVDSFTTFKISTLSMYPVENYVGATRTKLLDAARAMCFPNQSYNTDPNKLITGVQTNAATSTEHAIWKLNIKNAAGTTLSLWNTAKNTYITITNSSFTVIFQTIGNYSFNTTADMYAYLIYSYGTVAVTNIKKWSIGIWDNINGYPKCVSFYNGRLCVGSTDKYPSMYWLSASDKIYRFHDIVLYEDTSTDTSGLNTTNDEGKTSSSFSLLQGGTTYFSIIKWMCNGSNGLYIGTTNGIEVLSPGSTGILSQSNNSTTLLTNEGASDVTPVNYGGTIVYIARDKRRVIMLSTEGKTTDITSLYSEYLSRFSNDEEVVQLIVNDYESTLYVSTNYNRIFGIKLNTIESSWGLFEIALANVVNFKCHGINLCCLSMTTPILFIRGVSRIINESNTVIGSFSFEAFSYPQNESKERNLLGTSLDMFMELAPIMYMVNGAEYPVINGRVVTLFSCYCSASGANKFELTVIYKSTDGDWVKDIYPKNSFTGAYITLSKTPIANIVIGFAFNHCIKTLDLNFKNSDYGTPFGSIKRLDHVNFRIHNSIGFSFSDTINTLEEKVLVGTTEENYYSGSVDLPLSSSPERESRIQIEGLKGYPLHISSLVYKGLSSE